MNIVELKEEMENLLETYGYSFSDSGIEKIVSEWKKNKRNLISLFEKHPNYNGKGQIVFSHDYKREISKGKISSFFRWAEDILYKTNMYTWESVEYKAMRWLLSNKDTFIKKGISDMVNNFIPELKAKDGMKTSRLVNKFCKITGIDKDPFYNREFAEYADAINPLSIKRHTVISLNPVDYLTMSFGNSWTSCHTIDKDNKRKKEGRHYSGCYSSGTLSYMLDNTSVIFYTVDNKYNGNEFELQDKINRCMFHVGEDLVIQGRVYPQSKDRDDNLYKEIRMIVQKNIAECMEVPDLWINKKGTSQCNDAITRSSGTHYRDYLYFNSCNVSYIKGREDNFRPIKIGHEPICPDCGEEHSVKDNILCDYCFGKHTCSYCGSEGNEDNVHYVEGEGWFCNNCCSYCDYHGEYETGVMTDVYGYGYVCSDALYEIPCCIFCENCGNYYMEGYNPDEEIITEDDRNYCCERCANSDGYYETEDGYVYDPENNGYVWSESNEIYTLEEEVNA